MKRGRPIKPEEVPLPTYPIPPFVYDVFNTLIEEKMGDNMSAKILLKDVKSAIRGHKEYKDEDIFKRKWCDVEDMYREVGWEVIYDGPAYCETYDGYYVFSAPKNKKPKV